MEDKVQTKIVRNHIIDIDRRISWLALWKDSTSSNKPLGEFHWPSPVDISSKSDYKST